jgi:hypothetical protein
MKSDITQFLFPLYWINPLLRLLNHTGNGYNILRHIRTNKKGLSCISCQPLNCPPPASPQARLMLWLTHNANPSTASMVLPPFLTVILFVAMLPTLLAHCLFRFATQPKSQANPSIATKRRCTPTTTTVSLMPV